MLALILFLVIVYIAIGIIGFVVHGLIWLFAVAIVLFILTLAFSVFTRGRRSGKAKVRR